MQPATGFVQQEPNNGEPSTEQTEVRIAFDDDNLYLGVICLDSQPNNIVVTQNRRDGSLENTDSVQILFDTFNDKQNGVIFGTSPRASNTMPRFRSRPGPRWRRQSSPGGWCRHNKHQQHTTRRRCRCQHQLGRRLDGAFQITARGWEAEFKIPLRTSRYNPGDDVSWGMNIQRNLRRHNEQSLSGRRCPEPTPSRRSKWRLN